MSKKAALWMYLFVLHAALFAAAVRTSLAVSLAMSAGIDHPLYSRAIQFAHDANRLRDAQVPAGSAVFFGDSITAGLVTTAVAPNSVNYGIPGQRSDQLLSAMDSYASMRQARMVYLMIGTNDVAQGREDGLEDRYRQILSKIPTEVPVVFSSIPPIQRSGLEERSKRAAIVAREVCASDRRCVFVDGYAAVGGGTESSPGVSSDGVHLTEDGYRRLIQALTAATRSRSPA